MNTMETTYGTGSLRFKNSSANRVAKYINHNPLGFIAMSAPKKMIKKSNEFFVSNPEVIDTMMNKLYVQSGLVSQWD